MTEKKYKVYVHTNKVNGKKYVGQTCQRESRRFAAGFGYVGCHHFYRAIEKYGWCNFDHEILFDDLTKEEANVLEIKMIEEYQTLDPEFGYNIQSGGNEARELSEEGLRVLRENQYGGKSVNARKTVVYDEHGKRIGVFGAASEAARFLGVGTSAVSGAAKREWRTVKRNTIYYLDEIGDVAQLPDDMIVNPDARPNEYKRIAQYDSSGKYIASFGSLVGASELTGIPSSEISSVLSEKKRDRHTACGFQWRYDDGTTADIESAPRRGDATRGGKHYSARSVIQYDPVTHSKIAEIPSASDAARMVNRSQTAITYCCNRKNPTCGGFVFRWSDDPDQSIPEIELMVKSAKVDHRGKKRIVAKLDPITEAVIETYPSLSAAGRSNNVHMVTIKYACDGKTKTTIGYKWKYMDSGEN